ncbi:methyl-accepting chemotaxis protein [Bosea sp. LjRoot9]|uniref:methyl-accepting chemotaxis protein n=1 Tax=Bosea sp. LjRoot9 TaxID=3342341 RepID=UPI003ECFF0B9
MRLDSRNIQIPTVDEIEPRLRLYGIDDECRELARQLAPEVGRIIERVIRHNISITKDHLKSSRASLDIHGEALTRAVVSHFNVLFQARFDESYLVSLEQMLKVEFDSMIGARARLQVGQKLVLPLLQARAGRGMRRLLGQAVSPRDADLLMRLLYFDLVCAIAVEQHETRRAVVERHISLDGALKTFSQRTEALGTTFESSARELTVAARQMLEKAQATLEQSTEAEVASTKAYRLAAESADTTSQLHQLTSDMGARLSGAAEATATSVAHASDIKDSMADLAGVIEQVGSIVAVIKQISDQTNLLALNATIEAARAGDAGRGFAVVAHEVKNLAAQTGTATQAVAGQIEKIETAARRCVGSVDAITDSVQTISRLSNDAVATFASQFGLAGRISEAARLISTQSSDVVSGARLSSQAMTETIAAIDRVEMTALGLARSAETLRALVGELGATVAAA